MKKFALVLTALVCMFSMAAAAGAAEEGSIFKDLKATGVLKVAVLGNGPTFCFHKMVGDKDTLVGFEIAFVNDMAARLTKELGREIKVDFMEGNVTSGLAALQAGKVHFVPRLAATAEREKSYQFNKPYHKSDLCFIAQKGKEGDAKFDKASGLKGVKVGTGMGSIDTTMVRFLYPDAEIVEYEGAADIILAVSNGKIDLGCMNAVQSTMFCKANAERIALVEGLTYVPDDKFDPGCSLAMAKGNDDFVAWADAFFEDVKKSGVWAKWIQEAANDLDEVVLARYRMNK